MQDLERAKNQKYRTEVRENSAQKEFFFLLR